MSWMSCKPRAKELRESGMAAGSGREVCKRLVHRLQNSARSISFCRYVSNRYNDNTHFGFETISKEEKSERGAHSILFFYP